MTSPVPGRTARRARAFVAHRRKIAALAAALLPATRRSHTVRLRLRLRSRKLFTRVRPGGRYVLEVIPGLSHSRLGRPTRTTLRVR